MDEIMEVLKALSDETRLRIFNILKYEELCVCDIEEILGLKQANVSKHFMKLTSLNLVSVRKVAQWSHYSLNREKLDEYDFIEPLLKKLDTRAPFNDDKEKYKLFKQKLCGCSR